MFYRALTTAEEATFRKWARDHYKPGAEINGIWHPITQAECVVMNREMSRFVEDIATDG